MMFIIAASANILAVLQAIAILDWGDTKLLHGSMARLVVIENGKSA